MESAQALKVAEATIVRLAKTPAQIASVKGTMDVIHMAQNTAMHLFVFWTETRYQRIMVYHESEGLARIKLSEYLVQHPKMPPIDAWQLQEICGKFGEGIFAAPILTPARA